MKRLIWFIIFILAACSTQPKATITLAAGELRVNPPEGWVFEARQRLLLASNQAVLDELLTGSPTIEADEAVISINAFIPQAYPGLTNSSSLIDVLNIVAQELESAYPVDFDRIQFFSIKDTDAIYITTHTPSFDMTLVIVRLDTGFAVMNIFTSEGGFEIFKPTIETLIPTIEFE